MKTLPALLVAVALVCPAFAQNNAAREIQKFRKAPTTTPAFKPILVHTGRPITQNDKMQLMSTTVRTYTAKMPGAKVRMNNQVAASYLNPSATITPLQLFKAGFVDAQIVMPMFIDMGANIIEIQPSATGNESNMTFNINVNANTAYVLTFKVNTTMQAPQFLINAAMSTATGPQSAGLGAQTLAGTWGENEFAYSFIPSGSGLIELNLSSSNVYWKFESCEITATPIN